jgi:hypothetical protein
VGECECVWVSVCVCVSVCVHAYLMLKMLQLDLNFSQTLQLFRTDVDGILLSVKMRLEFLFCCGGGLCE